MGAANKNSCTEKKISKINIPKCVPCLLIFENSHSTKNDNKNYSQYEKFLLRPCKDVGKTTELDH